MGKDLEVEGFRKGYLPKEIIEKKVPQKDILEMAAKLAIQELYPKAILQKQIDIFIVLLHTLIIIINLLLLLFVNFIYIA